MNLLVKSGNQQLEEILKKFNPHNVAIADEITEKNISNIDCLIMLSSLNHCSDPEELNLKIQDIYNTLSLCVEQDIKNILTDDEFLRAKYTSPIGRFDEQQYNHILQRFGTDCEDTYKLNAFDFQKIRSYLELNKKTPKVECNVQGLKEKAEEIVQL